MFETSDYNIKPADKAIMVSIVCDKFAGHTTAFESHQSLNELRELLRTLGVQAVNEVLQNRKDVSAATIIGEGKVKEIALQAKKLDASVLVFDFDLTASQARNIAKVSKMKILDRCSVILQIFAAHARTREAQIQIEISRLQYMLPRLTSLWTHFTKQRGGIGLKGEGEQQLELDRRRIRDRIQFLKKRLTEVSRTRSEQRKRREDQIITAALVGYTNAGKSSLMNRLCKQDILEENKLFATLDSTYRTLTPDTKPPMVLIDTVGFISNLPNTLINGFKSTLESAVEADLLITVVDASDPNFEKQLEITQQVLKDLSIANKPQIFIFNKKDQIQDHNAVKIKMRKYSNTFLVSSYDSADMKNLRKFIINYFLKEQPHFDIFIPYDKGEVHALVSSQTNIMNSKPHDKGIFYRVRLPSGLFAKLGIHQYVLSPDHNYFS